MIIKTEKNLREFEFWGDAEKRAILLMWCEWDRIDAQLEKLYPEGLDKDAINRMFCYEFDFIARIIGETEKSILARKEIIK